jgi:hypothetical protein
MCPGDDYAETMGFAGDPGQALRVLPNLKRHPELGRAGTVAIGVV